MDDKIRIAVVNPERCKPKKCRNECMRICPVVRMGMQRANACTDHVTSIKTSLGKIECVVVTTVATISEELCNGCNMCVKVPRL